VEGKGKDGSEDIKNAEWIKVKDVGDEFVREVLVFGLDDGETEAIALAEAYGLNVLGTVGFLYREYKVGKIDDFDSALNKLRDAGFWISDELYKFYRERDR